MIDNEQAIDSRNLYTRASTVVFAGVCAVLTASYFFFKLSGSDGHSVFPGFMYMVSLCYPILYFWAGVLMRAWKPAPRWWVRIVIFGISIFCLCRYQHFPENRVFIGTIYFAMFGFGFLIRPDIIASSKSNRGWLSLLMLLLSVFCYTALETVRRRLLLAPVMNPMFSDMELMLETILVNAEPLLMMIVIYFAVQFAFSRIAQRMGSLKWFKLVMALPCIFMFIYSALSLFGRRFYYMVNSVYYSPLLEFIVQPVTIYLITVGCRGVRELRKKKEDRE